MVESLPPGWTYAHVPNQDSKDAHWREWFLVRRKQRPLVYTTVGRGSKMPRGCGDQFRNNEGGGDENKDEEMGDDIL